MDDDHRPQHAPRTAAPPSFGAPSLPGGFSATAVSPAAAPAPSPRSRPDPGHAFADSAARSRRGRSTTTLGLGPGRSQRLDARMVRNADTAVVLGQAPVPYRRPPMAAHHLRAKPLRLKAVLLAQLFCLRLRRVSRTADLWRRHMARAVQGDVLHGDPAPAELPPGYFDRMRDCPLPPGKALAALPAPFRHQAEAFALQRLVALFTPLAKRHCLSLALRSAARRYHGEMPAPAKVRAATPLLQPWPDDAVRDLLARGRLRAYLPGMWVVPPPLPRIPTARVVTAVVGFAVVHGSVAEYCADQLVGECAPLVLHAAEDELTGRHPARCFQARTRCLVLEVDWREIAAHAERLPPQPRQQCRDYVTAQRTSWLKRARPEAPDLRALPFFAAWEDHELTTVAGFLVPGVYFAGADIAVEGHADGGQPITIVARGAVTVQRKGGPARHVPAPCAVGEYAAVFQERPAATIRAAATVDVWTLPRARLVQLMKQQALHRTMQTAALALRTRDLLANADRAALRAGYASELQLRGWPADAARGLADAFADAAQPCIVPSGERLASAHERCQHVALALTGKAAEATAGGMVYHPTPFVLGHPTAQRDIAGRTLTAHRNVECWRASKAALQDALGAISPAAVDAITAAARRMGQSGGGLAAVLPTSPRSPKGRRRAGRGASRPGLNDDGSPSGTPRVPQPPRGAPLLRSVQRGKARVKRDEAKRTAELQALRREWAELQSNPTPRGARPRVPLLELAGFDAPRPATARGPSSPGLLGLVPRPPPGAKAAARSLSPSPVRRRPRHRSLSVKAAAGAKATPGRAVCVDKKGHVVPLHCTADTGSVRVSSTTLGLEYPEPVTTEDCKARVKAMVSAHQRRLQAQHDAQYRQEHARLPPVPSLSRDVPMTASASATLDAPAPTARRSSWALAQSADWTPRAMTPRTLLSETPRPPKVTPTAGKVASAVLADIVTVHRRLAKRQRARARRVEAATIDGNPFSSIASRPALPRCVAGSLYMTETPYRPLSPSSSDNDGPATPSSGTPSTPRSVSPTQLGLRSPSSAPRHRTPFKAGRADVYSPLSPHSAHYLDPANTR